MSRRVVVTGASRGLGQEIARQLSERGDEVWAGVRSKDGCSSPDGTIRVRNLDVANEMSIRQFATEVSAAGQLDLLINNAGTDARAFGAAVNGRGPLELSGDDFLAEMRVNAVGPMLMTRALLSALRQAAPGVVVNLSSQLGSFAVGAASGRDVGYNASKAALNMITARTASVLPAGEVTVVALHPGWVRTDMGGPEADLTKAEAVRALIRTIDRLSPRDSGSFIRADGSPHPW